MAGSLQIDPDGAVSVRVRKTAKSLVLHMFSQTRTWAVVQLGEGSSRSTWAPIDATAPVAAIVYEAPEARDTFASITGAVVVPVAYTLTLWSPAGTER